MAGTTRTTTPNRYVWLTWGVAPRCTAILHGRRRIQRYRSLTRLTDVALLSDPINSPRWPPESYLATTGDTNTTTATTLTRDRRTTNTNSKPQSPACLGTIKPDAPSRPKSPPSHKRGFEFSPPSLVLPFAAPVRTGTLPSRRRRKSRPQVPFRPHHSPTVPRRGSTAPKCRLALPLGASADALPKQGRSRSEVRRIACLAKHQQPAPTQPTHTTPTLFQWEFTAAAPANNTTRRSGLASGLSLFLRAWGEEAVNNKHTHPHRHFTIPPCDFPPERVLPFPISSILCFGPTPDNIYYFLYLWLRMTRRRHRARPSSVVSELSVWWTMTHMEPPTHHLTHLGI